jgi:hypothetical protein
MEAEIQKSSELLSKSRSSFRQRATNLKLGAPPILPATQSPLSAFLIALHEASVCRHAIDSCLALHSQEPRGNTYVRRSTLQHHPASNTVPDMNKEVEVPEWEHTHASNNDGVANQSTQPTLRQKFDNAMPKHKKYLGMKRNIFLLVLLAILLALLALIIGLAVGLTHRSKYLTNSSWNSEYVTNTATRSTNLPLPSNSQTFDGELTYFQTGLGACGETSSDSDSIVSVSHIIFDAAGSSSSKGGNSNANPLCGLMIRAERYDEDRGERRSIDLKVVDRCTGCQPNDLDVTYSAFDKLASRDRGRVEVTWAWL